MPSFTHNYWIDPEDRGRVRIRLQSVSKSFPGVKALDRVDFELKVGEVHALCGENGAGKSTLMNILSGNLTPDEGTILYFGQKISFRDPLEAQQAGIGIVYQEKSLVANLSVADNIFAGNQPINSWKLIDRKRLHNQTQQLLRKFGIHDIDSHELVQHLSPGKQQMVEIAKALSRDPQVLILDEPTSSISIEDARVLFKIARLMASQGKSIIYISHRLGEIFEVADRVTVLKDGHTQGTLVTAETDTGQLIRLMVGRDVQTLAKSGKLKGDLVLSVRHLDGYRFRDISFDLHRGEILGMAGLVGAGRSDLLQAIFGLEYIHAGEIILAGEKVFFKHPSEAIRKGIGLLPEDRKMQGLFIQMSVEENIISAKLNNKGKSTFIPFKDNKRYTTDLVNRLNIRTPSLHQKVFNLSGGNQQKIVFAKWLALNPSVLLIDEPTTGIDVGAKSEIYQILRELTDKGTSILLVSSDLPELFEISDRILVMRHGRITAEFSNDEFDEEEIMHYASGTRMVDENNS